MDSYSALPVEIHSQILAYLPARSIVALTGVNKAVRSIIQELCTVQWAKVNLANKAREGDWGRVHNGKWPEFVRCARAMHHLRLGKHKDMVYAFYASELGACITENYVCRICCVKDKYGFQFNEYGLLSYRRHEEGTWEKPQAIRMRGTLGWDESVRLGMSIILGVWHNKVILALKAFGMPRIPSRVVLYDLESQSIKWTVESTEYDPTINNSYSRNNGILQCMPGILTPCVTRLSEYNMPKESHNGLLGYQVFSGNAREHPDKVAFQILDLETGTGRYFLMVLNKEEVDHIHTHGMFIDRISGNWFAHVRLAREKETLMVRVYSAFTGALLSERALLCEQVIDGQYYYSLSLQTDHASIFRERGNCTRIVAKLSDRDGLRSHAHRTFQIESQPSHSGCVQEILIKSLSFTFFQYPQNDRFAKIAPATFEYEDLALGKNWNGKIKSGRSCQTVMPVYSLMDRHSTGASLKTPFPLQALRLTNIMSWKESPLMMIYCKQGLP